MPTKSAKAISGLTARNVGRPMEMGVTGSFRGRTVQSRDAICDLGFENLDDYNEIFVYFFLFVGKLVPTCINDD